MGSGIGIGSVGIGSLLRIALMPYSFSYEWSLSLDKERRYSQAEKKAGKLAGMFRIKCAMQ